MNEDDRPYACQSPRRLLQTKHPLYSTRYEPALTVEKEKRDHTNQRWKRRGKRSNRTKNPPAREVEAPKQKRERNPYDQRCDYGRDRDE